MYNANQLSITATPEAGAPRGTPRRPRLTATLVFVPSFVPAKRGVTSTMIVHREEVGYRKITGSSNFERGCCFGGGSEVTFKPLIFNFIVREGLLALTSLGGQASTLRELYALAASQQPLASLVSQQQQRLLELSRFRHYDLLSHQQGAVTKLLGEHNLLLEGSPVTWSLGPAAARGPFRVTMRAPQWTLMKPTEYVTTMKMISLSRQTKRPKRRFTVRGNKGAGGNRLLGGEAAT
ncbi:hypothetical protein J6590_030798 [Homalodisca vitripennis]|nr:hypothetical protein J6590_030798 [Homalodisca vitripennis]